MRNDFNDDNRGSEMLGLMIGLAIFFTIGFFAGYGVRAYQAPAISKQARLDVMNEAVDSMAKIAKWRAETDIRCLRCHGEDV